MKRNDDDLFDSAVRKKLDNREEEVPGYLWKRIEKKTSDRKFFGWLSSLNGLFFQDVVVTVSLLSFLGIHNAPSVSLSSSSVKVVNQYKHTEVNTNSVVLADNNHSTDAAVSINEKNSDNNNSENNSLQKANSIPTEKNTERINHSENNSSVNKTTGNTTKENSVNTVNENLNASILPSTLNKKRKNKLLSGNNSRLDSRENMLRAELLPVFPFNVEEDPDSLKYINGDTNTKHKFKIYPGLRIASGTSFIDGIVKTSDEAVITEDHSRKTANGTVFQLLFEYPLSEKWNLVAGVGQSHKNYSWKFMTTEEILQQTIRTRQGFIISPFDPPVPITITDTSYTKVALKNTADVNWSLQTTQVYIMGERSFHNRAVEVRVDAGVGVYLLNHIKEEINSKGETGNSITVKNSYSTSPKISALAAFEVNRAGGGMFQPFIRVQAEQLLQNQFKSSSSILYKEGSLSALIGLRLRFIK
ncbi:MAG: hypothetical protein ABI772_04165 [Bacteroidota bacterium]